MRFWPFGVAGIAAICAAAYASSSFQEPRVREIDERLLREYEGVYQWAPDAFVYLQLWNEIAGRNELVAFDESGEVRTLYSTGPDQFFAGPGVGLSNAIESRVAFQRDPAGRLISMAWTEESAPVRTARRVDIERRENVLFPSGDVQLAGTLIKPAHSSKSPAVILVHYSGPANRESVLPFARFLVRRGVAVLGYDKRGVGESTGDWNTASFDDLAGDAVAAFAYLKTRPDIDGAQVGLLGVSQAGWILPLAAVRAPDLAFLISVSGAAIPASETGLDHARNEMTASGMPPEAVEQVLGLMRAQYEFARTGNGWDDYLERRTALVAKMGRAPDNFPATPGHSYWQFMRRLFFYDPAPTLEQLRVPILAIFGELDNNVLADKNAAAWRTALQAGGHPDFTVTILPKANHLQLEATRGTNAEVASLRRFVPAYSATVHQWLAKRLRGLDSSAGSRSAF